MAQLRVPQNRRPETAVVRAQGRFRIPDTTVKNRAWRICADQSVPLTNALDRAGGQDTVD